jgi:STE24 endopeptidase
MVPLQSAPPALGPPLVAFVGLAVAGAVLGAVGSAVVRRLPNPVGKYRLFYGIALVPLAAVTYVLLSALELGPAIVGPVLGRGLLSTAVSTLVEMIGAGVVATVAYAPTVRGVRAVRDIDITTSRAIGQMLRYVVGMAALATLWLTAFEAGDSVLVWVVGLAVFVGVVYVAAPWYIPLVRSTRHPDGETADRLNRLHTEAGLGVRDTRILETGDAETAGVVVRGPPGYRRLFVTDTFLDAFDDETATALFAVQAGRVHAWALPRLVGTLIAVVSLLLLALGGPLVPLSAAALATLLVGLWFTRRGMVAADDYAAGRVGRETLAVALERYADFHALEPTRRRVPNPLSKTPALGDRIDRLRG